MMNRSAILSFKLLASLLLVAVMLMGPRLTSAQTGADMETAISGPRTVRTGGDITYTVTGTNVGDETATGVELAGWVPDWFNPVSYDCLAGTPTDVYGTCGYGDLAPGATATMTITVQACCPEKHMFEQGFVYASNDTNFANDAASIKVNFTGPRK
ncbi:MAG TPA: hypothetical protein VM450_10215 [Thermomicrobiales bacterium]|nr:hypothetical protein [Thermomicrobiales bacterium]